MNAVLPLREMVSPPHLPSYPYQMVWISTNACNARCIHCSSASAKRLPGEMTTAEVFEMLDQFSQLGILDLSISGGEPLTRTDMVEIVEYASSLRIKTGLGSNGSTLNATNLAQLRNAGLNRLQISLDGLEKSHDHARKWTGLFQKANTAIRLAIEAGLRVHVCMTIHAINYLEIEDLAAHCAQLGVARFNCSRFIPTGRGDASLDLTVGEWRRTIGRIEAVRKAYQGKMEVSTHLAQQILLNDQLDCMSGFLGCQAGIGQGCIGPKGEVTPCVMLPVEVGNLRQNTLAQIWDQSPVIQDLHDRTRLQGKCAGCFFKEKCGGCRAVAYAATGDYLAADPRCWLHECT